MRRLINTLAPLGTAAALVVAIPTSAHAATGSFSYTSAYTGLIVIVKNPADNRCIEVTAKGTVANNTDANADLFSERECAGESLGTLAPKASASSLEFYSVRFTRP